jgi:hypothetical protein
MKVKEFMEKLNADYSNSLKFSIHYTDLDGEYDEIEINTDFDKAVVDLFGERELCEEDSIWFAHDTLNLWIQ